MSKSRSLGGSWSRLFLHSLLLSAAASSVAFAQGAASAGAAPAEQTTVETVTIVAEKRTENVQKVPVSVSVVSGAALQQFHQSDLHDVMNTVPNLFVLQSGVDDVVSIRGFGSGPNNIAFDQEVSIYQDGIYGGRSAQFMAPLFDLDHLEVLRGPQGALFGKNTAAGAINIVTAGPTRTFSAGGTVDVGIIQTGVDASGYVAGPISDTLGGRIAVKIIDTNGFIKNDATGKEDPQTQQQLVRGTLKWQPTSNFDATLKAEYSNMHVDGGLNVSGPLTATQTPPTYRYVSDPVGTFGGKEENGVESADVSMTANYHMGEYTLTSVTGYSHFTTTRLSAYDQDVPGGGITPGSFANGFPEKFDQVSLEVRLVSPLGQRLEYVVGAYFDHSNYHLGQIDYYDLPAIGITGQQHTDFTQHAETYSVFGQGTLHIIDGLRLVGSLRYTDNHKDGLFTSADDTGTPLQAISTASGHIDESKVDPSASLQFDAARHVMLYATWGEGSKSGGFVSNTFGTTDATFKFKPEQSTNYEVGVKATLASGRLVLDADLYDTVFKNLQESAFDPVSLTFITKNAASATSRGFEASATWLPINSLELTLSAAYLDAKYDNFPGADCLDTQTTAQCNPADPASVAKNNLAGYPLLYASKWTGSIQGHHKLRLADDLQLDTTVIASLRSRYVTADNYDPSYGIQPTYVKVDARLQLGRPDGRWALALVGKNLTNVISVGDSLDLPFPITGVSRSIRWLDQGRSLSIEASTKF